MLWAGGEAISKSLVNRWAPHVELREPRYGPTEATIAATLSSPLRVADERVALGAPVLGMELLVLDGGLQPVPVGWLVSCIWLVRVWRGGIWVGSG